MDKILNITSKIVTKEEGSDELKIVGYASTSDIDRVGDVILPSAWKGEGLKDFSSNPIILFNHNYDKPIGKATSLEIDVKGLKIGATISKASGAIYDLIKEGVLGAFSVGLKVKQAEWNNNNDGLDITEAELLEVSVVSVPANQTSLFSVAKSFENIEDYNKWKKELNVSKDSEGKNLLADFQKQSEESVNLANQSLAGPISASDTQRGMKPKEKSMEFDYEEFAKTLADNVAKSTASAVAGELTKSQTAANEKAAAEKAAIEAEEKAVNEAESAESRDRAVIGAAMSGAQKLYEDLEKRLLDKEEDTQKVIDEMRTTLAEKSEEIVKMRDSKRHFGGAESSDYKKHFGDEAGELFMLSLATNKKLEDTVAGKRFLEKVNAFSGVGVSSADFEQEVSTNIERDVQLGLVLYPMFREVQMNAASMIFPVLPDSGYAEFTANQTASGITTTHGNLAQTGDTYGSPYGGIDLTERTVTTKKLISQSFLGNETEEDAIMPILPLIREEMIRSHSRGIENMILVGNHADGAFGTGGASPNGLIQIADADAGQTNLGASGFAATDSVTALNLLTIRRAMGKYAVRPDELVYIVSLDVYYDLLEDPEFQDANLVGNMATKITGEVGSIFGSKVVISPEFAPKAAAKFCAVAVNTRNYFIPRLRGFTVESDYEVKEQRRVLVASQRIGFTDIIDSATSVWGLQYKLT